MIEQLQSRRGVARLRPLLALTALAAAILTLCAVAENAGAPAQPRGCGMAEFAGLQAGGGVERTAVQGRVRALGVGPSGWASSAPSR